MFFSKHKKAAKEVSGIVSNLIRMAFVGSPHLKLDGSFQPPYGLWTDKYIIGFSFLFSSLLLQFEYRLGDISAPKKGEFMLIVFETVCGADVQLALKIYAENAQPGQQDPEFARGVDDAATYWGASTGNLKESDPSPILAEARKIAKGLHEVVGGLGFETSSSGSLGNAVLQLTLKKHIEDHFLDYPEDNFVDGPTDQYVGDITSIMEILEELVGKSKGECVSGLNGRLDMGIPADLKDPEGKTWFSPHYTKISIVMDCYDPENPNIINSFSVVGQEELRGLLINGSGSPEDGMKWTVRSDQSNPLSIKLQETIETHPNWELIEFGSYRFITRKTN
jgi:hypothetical protein